jgi:hypothetical protein
VGYIGSGRVCLVHEVQGSILGTAKLTIAG